MKKRTGRPNPEDGLGLYQRHRPTTFAGMAGNQAARNTLAGLFKFPDKAPHALAFVGAPGCGKTTAARICGSKLGATFANFAYSELDIADVRGVDDMRALKIKAAYKPLGGGRASWYTLDEFQMATREAQNILLKLLEDPPKHAYFCICTTDPHKVIPAIMSRCTVVKFEPVDAEAMLGLLAAVAKKEGFKLEKAVAKKIVDTAEGSPRKGLVLLEQAMPQRKVADQIAAVVKGDTKAQSIELCRALVAQKPWAEVAAILKNLQDDPEQVRRHVLGYANSVLLGGSPRGYTVIRAFQYDLFASGKAGLTAACWEARNSK